MSHPQNITSTWQENIIYKGHRKPVLITVVSVLSCNHNAQYFVVHQRIKPEGRKSNGKNGTAWLRENEMKGLDMSEKASLY
jgi:hypothetical protein